MNVIINGYIAFTCNSCRNAHTLESQSFTFKVDDSEEAENDEYVRYLSKIDTQCPTCANRILVNVDVWEFPESVVNYGYYGEEGAGGIECEFTIAHYFDDQAVKEEDLPYEESEEDDVPLEDEADDEEAEHTESSIEAYMDRYEDED